MKPIIWFELFPYGIWNSLVMTLKEQPFIIWTISLWDLKRKWGQDFTMKGDIWTISLWDLKHMRYETTTLSRVFELFPYGIWNSVIRIMSEYRNNLFELFPYGIWNIMSDTKAM